MSRLIDAEKLDLVSYQGIPDGYKDSFDSGILYAMNLIDEQPIIDAVPVVHGHWINSGYACGETDWECSVCHCHEWRTGKTEYCMRCGAKMDEVTE